MEPWIEEELNLYDFVGFWKRVLINIIDSLILILPTYLLARISVPAAESAGCSFSAFYTVCTAYGVQYIYGCPIRRDAGQAASGGKNR